MGKLNKHLHEVDQQAHEMVRDIVARLAAERGVNEALKAENALLWVQEIAQTVENIGMCLAVLPVVGLTLPFVSCGGSSLLATFILVGMVHSVSAHRPARRVGE